MQNAVWVFAIVFALGALQWLVFRRLHGSAGERGLGVDTEEVPNSELALSWEKSAEGGSEPVEEPTTLENGRVQCPRCGAENAADPAYSYCWNCLGHVI